MTENNRANRRHTSSEVARPRLGHAVVWVESPLQLLCAIEAHGAGLLGRSTLILPHGGAMGMDATIQALVARAPEGVRFGLPGLRVPSVSSPDIDRWVAGDAYSGHIQRALMAPVRAGEVVIVDDGLAIVSLLATLSRGRPTPLVRSRPKAGAARLALGLAAWYRLRRLARRGKLMVITALPTPLDVDRRFRRLGGNLEHHRFEWLGAQPLPEAFDEPTIVVGSALAADGFVHAEAYRDWIVTLTEDGPLSYFPHRRERPEFIAELAEHPDIRIRTNTVPVEMRLRGLREGQTVVGLPSSVLPSLRLLLSGNGVSIRGHAVPYAWWTVPPTRAMQDHLRACLEVPPT